MKFFSLISDKQLHIESDQKVVKAKDFTQLKKANQILKTVKQEAIEYKKKIVEESEIQKNNAYKSGFEEGLKQFNEAIMQLEQNIKQFREEIQKQILPLAIKAAKKIVAGELKEHPDHIVDMVMQALKPVMQHHHVTIYVNRADLEHIEKSKKSLKDFLAQVETFSILERSDLEPGDCIIQTESGIINAQLDNQWLALKAAFKKFMKK